MRVTGATAEVAIDRVGNLLARGLGISLKQLNAGHDHARGAVPTLQTMPFPESFLHRVQFAILCETFDRGDLGTIRLDCKHRARLDGFALEAHRARAANAGFAADMGPSELAVLAEVMD